MKNIFANVAKFVDKNLLSPLAGAVKNSALNFTRKAPGLEASIAKTPAFRPTGPGQAPA